MCCYQSQNYKIWKQFTTAWLLISSMGVLLSIAKLQNLKAIHNYAVAYITPTVVVINHKTTKFESNSQLLLYALFSLRCCYQSQNYKIWKQFTTWGNTSTRFTQLLSITKLQNLKAIHNPSSIWIRRRRVVINRKTTKFESNSQQQQPN